MSGSEIAAIALMAAGTATGAMGDYAQGRQEEANLDYQRDLAEFEADESRKKATLDAADQTRKYRFFKSRMQTIQSASGLANVGALKDILAASSFEAGKENQRIRTIGELNALEAESRADYYNSLGQGVRKATWLNVTSTLLTGAGKAMSMYSSSAAPTGGEAGAASVGGSTTTGAATAASGATPDNNRSNYNKYGRSGR